MSLGGLGLQQLLSSYPSPTLCFTCILFRVPSSILGSGQFGYMAMSTFGGGQQDSEASEVSDGFEDDAAQRDGEFSATKYHRGVLVWGPGGRLWTLKGKSPTTIEGKVPEALVATSPPWFAAISAPLPEVRVGEGTDGLCGECDRLVARCENTKSKQALELLGTVLRSDRQFAEATVLAEALLPFVIGDLRDDPYALLSALILMFSDPSTTTRRPRGSKSIAPLPPINLANEGDYYDGGSTEISQQGDWFPGIAIGFCPTGAPTGKGMPPPTLGIPKNASSQSLRYSRGGTTTTTPGYTGPGFLYMCKRPVSLRKIHSDLCLSGGAPGSPWLRVPRSTGAASTDMRLTSSTSSISEATAPPLHGDHQEDCFGPDWTDIGASASFCNEWNYNQISKSKTMESPTPASGSPAYPGYCTPPLTSDSLSQPPSVVAYDRPASPVIYVPQRLLSADTSLGSTVRTFISVPEIQRVAKKVEIVSDRSTRFNNAAMLRCFMHTLEGSNCRCTSSTDFIIVAGERIRRTPSRRGPVAAASSTMLMRVSDPEGNWHATGGSWPDLTAQFPSDSSGLLVDNIEDDVSFSEESAVDIRPTVTKCAVCHEDVKGLATICNACGHGGHVGHISEWFDEPGKRCPVLNCRCKCAF